jgi:hypothetical protein
VTYTYNADGTAATQTDAKNVVKTYAYDNYQRVTGATYNTGAGSNYTMTYDSDPLDPNGTFAMNTWGRLAEVSWGSCTSSAASRSYTEEYSYDTAGDVVGKRLSILTISARAGIARISAIRIVNVGDDQFPNVLV